MQTSSNESAKVTMRDMLKAGVHFGHRTRFWNPKMAPYIFGDRYKVHILNLEKTLPLYRNAVQFLSKVVEKKGEILFVGTKRAARDLIKEHADKLEMPYVNYRWLGGMLTNYKTVRQSIKRLKEIEEMSNNGTFEMLTKKEVLSLSRELTKLERSLGGIKDMKRLPTALFVIDVDNERIAVKEANKLGIPVVGIVDTNSDPEGVDYVIPGNDDAFRAIRLYLSGISGVCFEAKEKALTMGDGDDFVEVNDDSQDAESEKAEASKEESAKPEAAAGDEVKAEAEVETTLNAALSDEKANEEKAVTAE